MVFENVLNVLPLFAFVFLILSYLMWSKFLNKTKLGIKNVDHLLDIFIIFVFLLASTGGFIVLALMFLGIINLNLDLALIIKYTPFLIGSVGILWVISFITGYRNKTGKKEDLESLFKEMVKYYIIFAVLIGSYYLFTLIFTPLDEFIGSGLTLIFFISVFILSFCWNIVTKVLFGEKFDKFFNKDTIKLLGGIFVLGLALSALITPLVYHGDIEYNEVEIYNVDLGQLQKEYLSYEINVSLMTSGIISSIPSFIVLNYDRYGIILNDSIEKNSFEVWAVSNKSGKINFIDSYSSIENFKGQYSNLKGLNGLESKNGSVAIRFDRDQFKQNEIDYFIIKGLINTKIPENQFNYESEDFCYGDHCEISILVNSSLDLPVDLEKDLITNLINRDVNNISACKFDRIGGSYKLEGESVKYENKNCKNEPKACDFEIVELRESERFSLFEARFVKEDEGPVRRIDMDIQEPLQIELNVYLKC